MGLSFSGTPEEILAQPIPKEWIRQGKTKDGKEYNWIPVHRIKEVLNNIGKWDIEIVQVLPTNSTMTVLLKLTLLGRTVYGGATKPMGTGEATYQLVEAFAIKNAASKLGVLLGSELNNDIDAPDDSELQKLIDLYESKKKKVPAGAQINYDRIIKTKEHNSYEKMRKELNAIL